MGFFSGIGKAISKGFKDIGKVVSGATPLLTKIPGPIGTAAKIYTIGSSLFGKHSNPAHQTNKYLQQGANAQMGYQQRALDQYQQNMDRSLAMGISDKQNAYDIARRQFLSQQNNLLPYQQASLGMLKDSVPAIQSLLGLSPTQISGQINQYTPPELNYLDNYRNTADALNTKPGSSSPSSQGLPSSQGSTTSLSVQNDPNYKYNLEASPLYQWQRKQMEENLNKQLGASGLANSTYAQRELARQEQGLAAQERERTLGNLYSLANAGMGGANLGETFTPPQSNAPAQISEKMAQGMGSIYGNMGAIQGQLAAQQAQNAMASYNAQAQQPSPIGTALDLAHQFGWLGSGTQGINPSSGGGVWDTIKPVLDFGANLGSWWNSI